MVNVEIACRECPLKKDCDPHLDPYKYSRDGQFVTSLNKFECPSYTCGDGREDARVAIQTKKPRKYLVEIDGKLTKIKAVPFGQSFQKFTEVIVSVPEGSIFSLPPEGGKVYYQTGQSVPR